MGSRHASGDGGDSDDGTTSERDATRLLAMLIRSGQIRLITQDRSLDFMDDDDDDDDYEPYIECKPEADKCPDTKAIDKSELKQQMLGQAGLKHDASLPTAVSVNRLLRKRSLGRCSQGHFTPNDCAMLGANYLPNQMEIVARLNSKVFCGTYSKDGNVFLSACQDQYLRLYDVTKGNFQKFREIRARDVGWSIVDTAFSPDGCYLIYSSWSECIHLCNIYGDYDTHQALNLRPGDGHFCAFSVKFSSDNSEILAGANDGHLYIYDREKNDRILRIDAHEDDVNAVCFADDSSHIIYSGADDGLCKVWDRRMLGDDNATPVGILAGHQDGITYIDAKGDSRHLITNSKDQSIKLWDMRKFSSNSTIEKCRRAVATQHWDYRWQGIPRSSRSKKKTIAGDSSLMTYRGHGVLHTLIRCYFSPTFSTGQRYIYTGCGTGKIVIYDVLTGQIVSKLDEHHGAVRDVSWHPYEPKLMSTSWDGTHGLWTYKKDDYPEDEDPEDSLNESSDDETDIFKVFRRKSRRLQEQRRERERRQQRTGQGF
ncbi:DDB1- and CUL4-associated factor 11-like [Amphiura filiformis]|uniref:DDB1- and CUL4-associated factor 11-like n=1 Tax=Amphiura filiformis TaxID=82378 RepID=UPI003B213F52